MTNQGLMMDRPLLITQILSYAAEVHGDEQVISSNPWDGVTSFNYKEIEIRTKKLAQALLKLDIDDGDKVGTIAWNGHRHLELYYAGSGIGAITHTINPRLFRDQIIYIVNHGQDKVLFFDYDLADLVMSCYEDLTTVEHYICMTTRENIPEQLPPNCLIYEDLLDGESSDYQWPEFDENRASSMCYSSGTTGNPKGVLYSHRSTVLHAFTSALNQATAVGPDDVVMLAVPMFHVNAWGMPYYGPLNGASLVLPGPQLDGESLYNLIRDHGVTFSAGVPTVWLGLLTHAQKINAKIPNIKRIMIGGAAAPPSIIDRYDQEHDIRIVHAWGMTEMSPLGTVGTLSQRRQNRVGVEISRRLQGTQGPRLFGVEMKIVDDEGIVQPHDGKSRGHLYVQGPTVIRAYYDNDEANRQSFDAEGWFKTGDIAVIDEQGFVTLVDRSKDVIKSGGEWISSIDLENAAISCTGVVETAVIGAKHEKWDERPVLFIVAESPISPPTEQQIRDELSKKVVKWWMPDRILFVDEIPHTATGKINKLKLREAYGDCLLN